MIIHSNIQSLSHSPNLFFLHNYYFLKQNNTTKHSPHTYDKAKELEHVPKKNCLLCIRCTNPITDNANKITIGQSHLHKKINPQGFIFTIGCFQLAPGCIPNGPISNYYAWFSGYSWLHQICNVCNNSLGWYFSSEIDSFFGLIIDNLIEEEY